MYDDDFSNDRDDFDDEFERRYQEDLARDAREASRKAIIIVDDTLDMELKKHRILQNDEAPYYLFHSHNVEVIHVKDNASALRVLQNLKENYVDGRYQPIKPENVIVISDYKLQNPGEKEEWGPDILESMAADPEYRPGTLFLMSKSGFRGEDKARLDAIGAQYFHTNEFFFTAANDKNKEALKEVFSQRATTHLFREWFNQQFGTDMPLDQYHSPNIAELERGNVPVDEIMRRIRAKTITHPEAVQLIDEHSVRAAFRSRVDAEGVPPDHAKTLEHGIQGPSVAARLAYSEEDIVRLRAETPDAPIILALDHDYSPRDHTALSHANAVLMLKKGTQHIAPWANDANIPVLFANKDKYLDFSVQDGTLLMRHEGIEEPVSFAHTGDWLTVDGTSLTLYRGQLPILPPSPEMRAAAEDFARTSSYHNHLTWHYKKDDNTLTDHTGVNVMVNASTAEQVAMAKQNPGVSGVGLVRTESMLRDDRHRTLLLQALLAEGDEKQSALQELTWLQVDDLTPILAQQDEQFPINLRLFDFPPAEFFPSPTDDAAIAAAAEATGLDAEKIRAFSQKVYEQNLRGVGLIQDYPELFHAQCDAIFTAAQQTQAEPRILVPAVRNAKEMDLIRDIAEEASEAHNDRPFTLGAMIETLELAPQSYDREKAQVRALQAVVRRSDFICLGTNDLTEELLGVKRDDLESQIAWSHETRNPIKPFDELAADVERTIDCIRYYARDAKPTISITLCGGQAMHRKTAEFCQDQTLDALSVPASADTITQALVETGRAALLESTRHREIVNRDIAARQKAEDDLKNGALPESVENLSEEKLKTSPIAFIVIEDDTEQRYRYTREFRNYPAIVCSNISDALKTANAMQKQGKQVHLYSDANVLLGTIDDHEQGTMHPACEHIDYQSRTPSGVLFARAIDEGKIEGLKTSDISLMSAFLAERIPMGVASYSKLGDIHNQLRSDMDERIEKASKHTPAATTSAPASGTALPESVLNLSPDVLADSPVAFIMLEDDWKENESYATELAGKPVLICETISDGLKAIDAMHALGKQVHIITDANIPRTSWEEEDKGTAHPTCKKLPPKGPGGIALVDAVCSGEIEGLGEHDISVVSSGRYELPETVPFYGKSPQLTTQLQSLITERMRVANTPDSSQVTDTVLLKRAPGKENPGLKAEA